MRWMHRPAIISEKENRGCDDYIAGAALVPSRAAFLWGGVGRMIQVLQCRSRHVGLEARKSIVCMHS